MATKITRIHDDSLGDVRPDLAIDMAGVSFLCDIVVSVGLSITREVQSLYRILKVCLRSRAAMRCDRLGSPLSAIFCRALTACRYGLTRALS